MKIKYKLLDKLNGLTTCEMDLYMYAVRRQNEEGVILGLYYREVCKAMSMCKQSFYNALYALKEKGLIKVSKNARMDYDLLICDNDFSYKASYAEGYINLNRKVFRSRQFQTLKANEKWLFLDFMKLTHASGRSVQISVRNLYKKYSQILKVTRKVITGYLRMLKKFFSIGIKDGKYFITYKKSVFEERNAVSEYTQYISSCVGAICRRNKIKELEAAQLKDSVEVIKQYKESAKQTGQDILELYDRAVKCCGNYLNGAYINKLIREAIEAVI